MRSLEVNQNFNLHKHKSLALKYPIELPITLLIERLYIHFKAFSEVICPGNVSMLYEEAK